MWGWASSRRWSWQLLEAEVDQEVAGEGQFGGDAVGELGAGAGTQFRRECLPGVRLDLQVPGEWARTADEAGSAWPGGRGGLR